MSRRKNKKTGKQHRVNPQNVNMDRILPKAASQGTPAPVVAAPEKKAGKSKNPVNPVATAPETPKAKAITAAHIWHLQAQIIGAIIALRELTTVLSRPADATLAEGGVPRAVREHLTSYAVNVLHVDLAHLIEEILVVKGFPLAAGVLTSSAPGGVETNEAGAETLADETLDDEEGPVDEGEEEMPRPIELAEGEDAPPHEDEQDPVIPVPENAVLAAPPAPLAAPPMAAPVTLPSNWNNNSGNS